MKITILPFFFYVILSQNFTNYPCPEECACNIYQDYDGEFVFVNCDFKFIGINLTDFSSLETKVTSVLQVNCDPFYYSEVGDKMFQHLHAFKALYFQSCGFDYIPEHALYGLGNLKKLQIYEATHLRIHANAFLNAPILEELIIVSSGLQSLASVHMPTLLQFVNFTNNYIESLSDSGLFDEGKIFYNMEFFIINKNKIAKLDRNFSLTLPAIIHISVEENIIAHVSEDSFRHLTNLEYADFTNNRILMLPDSLLSDAINLKAFGIGFNPISSIPSGLFNATRKLEVLDFHQINIDNAVWNTLKTLSSLHELQLGENRITEMNLNELDMLWYLNLSYNKIREIKNRTFIHQQQLETLNLDHNLIDMIEPQGFHGLHTLYNLRLNGNKLTFIHQNTFQPLPKLLLLNMSFNFLEYFPPVSYLHNLYVLDLRYNNISWINKSCFIGLDSIAGINLSFNKIKVLTYDVFQAVPSLQLLVLSFNEIDVIEQSTFTKLGLKWIFLDNNRISDISEVFKEMLSLIQLDLHHNEIKGTLYTKYFSKLPSLQQLILSFNYFTSIESRAFSELNYLSFVDFRHNKISTLNPESIMFSKLAKPPPVFYFVGNDFVCDCNLAWMRKCLDKWTDRCSALDIHEFEILHCYRGYKIKPFSLIKNANINSMLCNDDKPSGVPCPQNCSCWRSFDKNYNVIDCSNQNIMEFNHTMPTNPNTLYLDGNNFTLLQARLFQGLLQLEVLYLNNSQIETIETGSFALLYKLKVLYLNDNMLRVFSSSMLVDLTSLEYLNLENNFIMNIEKDTFNATTGLQTLLFANNLLVLLDVHIFDSLVNLTYISMAENPWSCECEILKDLKMITHKFAGVIKDRNDIYCYVNSSNYTSDTGNGLKVLNIDMFTFCPNDTIIYRNATVEKMTSLLDQNSIKALIATLSTFITLVVIAVIIFVNRHLLQVVLYNKLGIKFCREKTDEYKQYDAFVSYSHRDEQFIVNELLPRLETVEGYTLCVHFRDFPVGASIADSIIESVENSRRTIMVVSNNFVDSEWCQYEFKTAHLQVLRDKYRKIILILMENIEQSKLDPELKLYMKTKTYLKRQDPWFWEKIVYAMPERNANDDHRLNDLNKVEAIHNLEKENSFVKNIL